MKLVFFTYQFETRETIHSSQNTFQNEESIDVPLTYLFGESPLQSELTYQWSIEQDILFH